MIVGGIQCPKCKDIIYSRAGHDFRYCTCGDCFVDGGQGEFGGRVGYTKVVPEHVKLEAVGVESVKELYADWNYTKSKYGLIKGGQVDLSHRIISVGAVGPEGSERPTPDLFGRPSDPAVREPEAKRAAAKSKRKSLPSSSVKPAEQAR